MSEPNQARMQFRYGFASGWLSCCFVIYLLSLVFERYLPI